MKKIYKFVAPNGEYVEWGVFDDKKRIVTLEVKTFSDDGVMGEKEEVDFILPETLDLNSKINFISSYKMNGFMKTDSPNQDATMDNADNDPREVLHD